MYTLNLTDLQVPILLFPVPGVWLLSLCYLSWSTVSTGAQISPIPVTPLSNFSQNSDHQQLRGMNAVKEPVNCLYERV